MTPEEQRKHTPFSVLACCRAIGKIPKQRALQIDPSGQKYYFQNDGGKICLTRYNNGPQTQTPALLDAWQKFRDALAGWEALTPGEKDAYNRDPEAKRKAWPGRILFMSRFMKGAL